MAYRKHVASELSRDLIADRRIVVSGAAYGIHAVAHKAALIDDDGTIVVLADGLGRPYPANHAELLEQSGQDGLLVSEPPPSVVPTCRMFLNRHRLQAVLSGASIVVEADSRSGALGVVDEARCLGREAGAVPGQVTGAVSRRTNLLFRDRVAKAVLGCGDVIQLLEGNPPRVPLVHVDQIPVGTITRDAPVLSFWHGCHILVPRRSVTDLVSLTAPRAARPESTLYLSSLCERRQVPPGLVPSRSSERRSLPGYRAPCLW